VAADAVAESGKRKNKMSKTIRSIHWCPDLRTSLAALMIAIVPAGAGAQNVSDLSDFVAESLSPTFEDSGALIDAFRESLANNDVAALAELLGLDPIVVLDDEATVETFVKIRDGVAKELVIQDSGRRIYLQIGKELWPFPFPIVRDDDGNWSFDTMAGLEEIANRRVGENELEAINTARAYIDAQREYATQDRDGDGVLEYAQKLISSDGETDGLYWPASPEAGVSPAGDFADENQLDAVGRGEGYFGYRFRILRGQGDNIAGGAYDFVINDNMIAGFALIAWPVSYAQTGARTFVVSHHGTVYEKDLGPATAEIAAYIESFNPDDGWEVTKD
jgi:Protein of unknown function (DUF2950)